MSGRIRTIKPELLEDAVTAGLSDMAFRIFIACILVADDHGGLRFEPRALKGQIFWARDVETDAFLNALGELEPLIEAYVVKEQRYGAIRNWRKHQRVDKPGKPRIPRPPSETGVGFPVAIANASPEHSRTPREPFANDSRPTLEPLAPDLRSPISDPDPERDLPRAHARVAEAPESETTCDQARVVIPADEPPPLDAAVPEHWLVQAQAIVRSRSLDVDPKASWRCYVLRLNEPAHRAPASLARYLRWVHDDCSRAAQEVARLERREWSGPRLATTSQGALAPYHGPARPPPGPPAERVTTEEREAMLRAAGLA